MKLDQHPNVLSVRSQPTAASPSVLDAAELKQLCLDAGVDDVGLVELDRPNLASEKPHCEAALPGTRTLIALVKRMNREPIRSTARSVANLEFHQRGDEVNHAAAKIVRALEARGVRALNPAMGFPMEIQHFPGRLWVVSHKPVAIEAGLGRMGIHRNLIHPKFGNFLLLGTVLVAAEASEYDRPIDYNPCLECRLCVAACPVGAIDKDGGFDFSACYTHNYREFMGGFGDWAETVADSKSREDYRDQVTVSETASMWQSLSYGANYKAAYCLAACPAGEDVLAPWLDDKREHLDRVVKPLQQKEESIYVVPGTDAEAYVTKRYPHKPVRHVRNSLVPTSIEGFYRGMRLTFQARKARGVQARYHLVFTGDEPMEMTVDIDEGKLEVQRGLQGQADFRLRVDSALWLRFLATQKGLVRGLLTRKLRFRGSPKHLLRFGECFA